MYYSLIKLSFHEKKETELQMQNYKFKKYKIYILRHAHS